MAKRFGWLLATACLMVSVQPAFADELEDARKTFTLGEQHLTANRLEEACIAFDAVLKVVEVPAVAYKAAQAHEKLGKLVTASDLYATATKLQQNQYWADKQTQLKAQRDAADALKALGERIPTLRLEIQGDANAIAELTVDGTKLSLEALATPQRLDPGNHVVAVMAKNGQGSKETVTLVERDRKTLA